MSFGIPEHKAGRLEDFGNHLLQVAVKGRHLDADCDVDILSAFLRHEMVESCNRYWLNKSVSGTISKLPNSWQIILYNV